MLARTVDSVVVRVFPFPAVDHVPVNCIWVRVQVGEEAVEEEEVRPRNGAAAFSGPVEHVVRRPAGSALAVTSRCCVLGDDALSNTFAWSDAARTRTLQLPAAPRAAVVESCAPASATLRLENAGRTSDPQAVGLELRCNDGAVQAVPLPSADAVEVVHVLRQTRLLYPHPGPVGEMGRGWALAGVVAVAVTLLMPAMSALWLLPGAGNANYYFNMVRRVAVLAWFVMIKN